MSRQPRLFFWVFFAVSTFAAIISAGMLIVAPQTWDRWTLWLVVNGGFAVYWGWSLWQR